MEIEFLQDIQNTGDNNITETINMIIIIYASDDIDMITKINEIIYLSSSIEYTNMKIYNEDTQNIIIKEVIKQNNKTINEKIE